MSPSGGTGLDAMACAPAAPRRPNVRDVRATFHETYTLAALARLPMPVVVAVGERSPDVTHRIARAIASHARHGAVLSVPGGSHAMTTTHPDKVADLIVQGDAAGDARAATGRPE
jgi:pimeloyl-ACP methyl ester carboxylesterase